MNHVHSKRHLSVNIYVVHQFLLVNYHYYFQENKHLVHYWHHFPFQLEMAVLILSSLKIKIKFLS